MNQIKYVVASIFFVMLFSFPAMADEYIPALSTKGLQDKILQDGKGRVVVVNIFASWCFPCREEIPNFIAARNTFSPEELLILGVSVDDPTEPGAVPVSKALNSFVASLPINYPVFIAVENLVSDLNIQFVPQLFVYDQTGKLVKTHVGFISQGELEQVVADILAKKKA